MSFRKFARNNSLSLAIFSIFIAAIIGMSFTGWLANNNDLADHNQPPESYFSYVSSGEFVEGVFENWEGEFLQIWALIILTIFFFQKGSADSKPLAQYRDARTLPLLVLNARCRPGHRQLARALD